MKLLSSVFREQAEKLGIEVVDVPGVPDIAPEDIQGIPTPRSWDRAGRMMREAATLTPEEKSLYERFSVEQAQAMAQGRRGDSVQCTVLDEVESIVPSQAEYQKHLDRACDLPAGAKIIAWNGKK